MEEESTLVRAEDPKHVGRVSSEIKPDSYRLYFKGLVSEETVELLAGFGVAICDKDDNLLFQMKEQVHDSRVTVLEVEIMALKRGLTEAVGLGIDNISIYSDHYRIFELVMEKSASAEENFALLMDNVQHIRQRLTSSFPVLVTRNQIKFVYELAMETIVSEISIHIPDHDKTCSICSDDNFEPELMFSVALCGHEFCVECVKRHIEVRLLAGGVPRCLHYQCESKLTLANCANLLTSKLKAMWELRIEEESIPVEERVYCPNPRCSSLMSVTKLSNSTREDVTMRSCVKCGEPFCINCKLPWHSNLSCNDYKSLGPNPTADDIKLKALANQKMWRQCENCKNVIELSEGCMHITCRCGHQFCYKCGAKWITGRVFCTHSRPPYTPSMTSHEEELEKYIGDLRRGTQDD
ncbi:putative protein [Arabidopsis thaliana]|uniref:RBR-type E3 ubiquitin transferase n=1 Tax=Arabidopsis thaliana TaxID=3702 RepID=Q9M1E9_ARATH|nr:RING/U-box protein with C6HC-type zinc finger [Arabidopsis thaliana]AEE78046.1 RING/U-box protein with C6HC-type zinc finger [Arabidopsis thaliana]CAB75487.1 putative protein [Arabidopsis thaliana]|eukprot:NP_190144.1 RING/U-box protein with C6HC-type zinc finger [Arabidopsis thaliana]